MKREIIQVEPLSTYGVRSAHPTAADPDDLVGLPVRHGAAAGRDWRRGRDAAVARHRCVRSHARRHRLRPNFHPDLLYAGAALRLHAAGTKAARRSPSRPETGRRVDPLHSGDPTSPLPMTAHGAEGPTAPAAANDRFPPLSGRSLLLSSPSGYARGRVKTRGRRWPAALCVAAVRVETPVDRLSRVT